MILNKRVCPSERSSVHLKKFVSDRRDFENDRKSSTYLYGFHFLHVAFNASTTLRSKFRTRFQSLLCRVRNFALIKPFHKFQSTIHEVSLQKLSFENIFVVLPDYLTIRCCFVLPNYPKRTSYLVAPVDWITNNISKSQPEFLNLLHCLQTRLERRIATMRVFWRIPTPLLFENLPDS